MKIERLRFMEKRIFRFAFVAVLMALLSSCSSNYVDVIPRNAKAVVAVSPRQLGVDGELGMLGRLVGMEALDDCGINLKENIYLFVAPDGMFGLVAEVSSESNVDKFFSQLVEKHIATEFESYKGYDFSVVDKSFLVGKSSNALLVMGPSVAAEHLVLKRRMAKYLNAESSEGFSDSEMYARLSDIDAGVAVVAQLKVLPDNIAIPFSMTMPKEAPLEKCYVSAAVNKQGNVISIEGETFSFDGQVNDSIKAMKDKFKPISDTYLNTIPADRLMTLTCSMAGNDLLNMMRSNNEMRTLLFGVNTSIDIDKMVRSVDGQIVVGYDDNSKENNFSMLAEVANTDWLSDVGYWKRSSPQGTVIEEVGDRKFRIHSEAMDVYFGIDNSGKLIYITSDDDVADNCTIAAAKPLGNDIRSMAVGKKLAIVVNINSFVKVIGIKKGIGTLLSTLGGIDTIVVTEN